MEYDLGDDFSWVVYKQSSTGGTVDITGKLYDFAIQDNQDDTTCLLSKSDIIPTRNDGEITIAVNKSQMNAVLSSGCYFYTLIEKSGTTENSQLKGEFKVTGTARP